MSVTHELTSRELAESFKTSPSTLSRWVSNGCPYREIQGPPRTYLFDESEVRKWLQKEGMMTEKGELVRFKSRRGLKRYHLFSINGVYVETIIGSSDLVKKLKENRICDTWFPYAIDESGEVLVYYSGKLRNHDTAGKGGAAGCILPNKYPEKLKSFTRKMWDKFSPGQFELCKHDVY